MWTVHSNLILQTYTNRYHFHPPCSYFVEQNTPFYLLFYYFYLFIFVLCTGEVERLLRDYRQNQELVRNIGANYYQIIYPVQIRHHDKMGISTREVGSQKVSFGKEVGYGLWREGENRCPIFAFFHIPNDVSTYHSYAFTYNIKYIIHTLYMYNI